MDREQTQLKGVNLGGWLVLERWITPSLFEGLAAKDEYSFCLELGDEKKDRLERHHREFITEDDFKWIADHGLNAVRIPIGHWIFGDQQPYVGSIKILDESINLARKYNLQVLIDLHAAPGSQNGWAHSGRTGEIGWHKNELNIRKTLESLEKLAKRYADQSNVFGIELINEPHWNVPLTTLKGYYERGYKVIRQHMGSKKAVVISDAFRSAEWENVMMEPEFSNVILDTHLYQRFSAEDVALDINGHLQKTNTVWKPQIEAISAKRPLLVGEWGLRLDPATFKQMSGVERRSAVKAYAEAQLSAFEKARGWFFWTYKTEERWEWRYRYCVEKGLLPTKHQ
jgi:glucan 1,3-beta-glucosidase